MFFLHSRVRKIRVLRIQKQLFFRSFFGSKGSPLWTLSEIQRYRGPFLEIRRIYDFDEIRTMLTLSSFENQYRLVVFFSSIPLVLSSPPPPPRSITLPSCHEPN